jgi:hypothetical protein
MTLAPETGEVSWVSMGLRRVLFLTEVDTLLSKSQDPLSSSVVVALRPSPKECCRPSRHAMVPGPNRLVVAPQPLAGTYSLELEPLQNLDPRCDWPECRSVMSHCLDFTVTVITS